MGFNFKPDSSLGEDYSITMGTIIIVHNDNNSKEIYLLDENCKRYPIDDCYILTDNSSPDNSKMNIPKPYEIRSNGEIINIGSRVLIAFAKGKIMPIILGSLNSLAMQSLGRNETRITLRELENTSQYKKFTNGNKRVTRLDENFDSVIYEGINYKRRIIKASAYFGSSNYLTVEGEKQLNLFGDDIELANTQPYQVDKTQTEEEIKKKAKNVNIYAEKICLGHSNKLGNTIPLDVTDNDYLNPMLQKSVMGQTLQKLLDLLIEYLLNAQYMGNGVVVTMSVVDKNKIKTKVKQKLPLILSEVVTLLAKAEQTKKQ